MNLYFLISCRAVRVGDAEDTVGKWCRSCTRSSHRDHTHTHARTLSCSTEARSNTDPLTTQHTTDICLVSLSHVLYLTVGEDKEGTDNNGIESTIGSTTETRPDKLAGTEQSTGKTTEETKEAASSHMTAK